MSSHRKRQATHAGSWYEADKANLDKQLEGWLAAVNTPLRCIGPQSQGSAVSELPVRGARIIIAPHAGYSYSGPAAAFAYRALDLSKARRVFLLGPSHHYYLSSAALSKCTQHQTPFGELYIDGETTATLYKSGQFEWMDKSVDEAEHSLEMHLPYIYKAIVKEFGHDSSEHPLLVPIMIGNTSASTERALGRILAPYLADPVNAFVISSDFAHWGLRFRYTYYRSAAGLGVSLSSSSKTPQSPAIHESIKAVDFECIDACEGGSHHAWLRCLEETGNTVCGRHPIGVIMAAIEEVREQHGGDQSGKFQFVRYERSSEVKRVNESSVSYASAFAVI